MNTFALEIWDDEGERCTIYTLVQGDSGLSETDQFFERYEADDHPYHQAALELLNLIVQSIGSDYGATDDFINRTKNKGYALPPKPHGRIEEIRDLGINFPLRLYCYRVNEQLLILCNGGLKDSQTDQDSKELKTKFYEIQGWIERIENALRDEMIKFNPHTRKLEDFNGNEDIIL